MCDAGCAPRCGRATKMTLVFMLLSLMLAICCVTFYAICTARVGLDSKICPENATVADILDGVADPRADPRDFVRNAVSKRVQLDASSSDRGTDKGPSEEIVSQYSCRPWFLLLVASAALLTTSILAFSCSGRISFAWEKSKRSE